MRRPSDAIRRRASRRSMPSSFRAYAVDFDGETLRLRPLPTSGKVDLGASKLLQTLRERRQSLL